MSLLCNPFLLFGGGGAGGGPLAPSGVATYTQAEQDAWTTGTEYTRLASSFAGDLDRTTDVVPASIPTHGSAARPLMVNASISAKAMAMLYEADGNSARLTFCNNKLAAFSAMEQSWTGDTDARLSMAWTMHNVLQAASIANYPKATLGPFLRFIYPYMDWWGGFNWHASFSAVRLMIAGWLEDEDLWDDALAYFEFRIAQGIYHQTYDGASVNPLLKGAGTGTVGGRWPQCRDGVPWTPYTESYWNNQVTSPAWTAVYNGDQMPNGTSAERRRDLSHESMALAAYMDAARTIVANGYTVAPHAHARLLAFADYHGQRSLTTIQTGTIPTPVGTQVTSGYPVGTGGDFYKAGWYKARKYLGGETPDSVDDLLNESAVENYPAAGALHLSAEAFGDA